jgi:heptosyltransferase-1
LLARWSGAPVVFGDVQPRENVASMFYSRKVLANNNGTHVIEQALELAEAIVPGAKEKSASAASPSGAASTSRFNGRGSILQPHVEFPVDPDAEKKIASFTADAGEFIILNPGAGWGAKMWPAERYGQVAKELAKDGFASLVNYGPREEDLAVAVETSSEGTARKISCSISELVSLTRRASAFIGGDTGPMHLAAALKIPVVAVFGPTNPARNGPYATQSIVLRSAISTTDHSRRVETEQGLLEITSGDVIAATRKLLRNRVHI